MPSMTSNSVLEIACRVDAPNAGVRAADRHSSVATIFALRLTSQHFKSQPSAIQAVVSLRLLLRDGSGLIRLPETVLRKEIPNCGIGPQRLRVIEASVLAAGNRHQFIRNSSLGQCRLQPDRVTVRHRWISVTVNRNDRRKPGAHVRQRRG